ncbi:MAG TPA: hypothetical protein PK264_11790 [Hyphomicrobiaceae bacterium]|nr:hypothetical protein [Hyphomicrobiaceae bacterium]
MRKMLFVLLGLVLIGGAIGNFAYRSLYSTERARTALSAPSAGAPADRGRSYIPERPPTSRTTTGTPGSGGGLMSGLWGNFEMVINILNVLVGILGIWMTMIGMRLQRQALRQDQRR